jgi:hypothetical protein
MMESAKKLDLSKLPPNAQAAITEIYNLLLNKEAKKKKGFEFIINNPLKVDRIALPSRDELHER